MENQSGRDAKGRFVKGHKSKGGRPSLQREIRYYEILMGSVTFEDWRRIVEKAAEQAKRGDAVARKWLSDYLVGQPEQDFNGAVEITIRYENRDTTA